MTEKETFDYCIGSFRNFLKSFVDTFGKSNEDKFQFEMCTAVAIMAHDNNLEEINQFSRILTKSILHYGDKLLVELRKVFEEVVPEDRRIGWN